MDPAPAMKATFPFNLVFLPPVEEMRFLLHNNIVRICEGYGLFKYKYASSKDFTFFKIFEGFIDLF